MTDSYNYTYLEIFGNVPISDRVVCRMPNAWISVILYSRELHLAIISLALPALYVGKDFCCAMPDAHSASNERMVRKAG